MSDREHLRKGCSCCWKEDSNGLWHTECGNIFELMNGSPHDNGMRFCCYCGKSLREHMYEEVESNDD